MDEQKLEQTIEKNARQRAEQDIEQGIEQAFEQALPEGSSRQEGVGRAMEELQQTVARLRAPQGGCPWDKVQTHESLKAACVEEAAEVVCGINILSQTGSTQSLREELGDLLLQVVMHAQIAEEEGLFTMEDVIRGINEKMIRRHPHVFGEESLKYLPAGYIRYMQQRETEEEIVEESAHSAREAVSADTCQNTRQEPSEGLTEAQSPPKTIPADWKQIKYYEKLGREWEDEYLFRAFDEAEHLIGVARKRKSDKKNRSQRGYRHIMQVFPLMQKIDGRKFLVIGAGAVARRKVRLILQFTHNITIITQTCASKEEAMLRKELSAFVQEGTAVQYRCYTSEDLLQADYCIASTDSRAENHKIARFCHKAGISVNVPDDPESCTFIMPSVIKKGDLLITVSTGGKSPAMSAALRRKIEEDLPVNTEEILDRMAELRTWIPEILQDSGERGRLYADLLSAMMKGTLHCEKEDVRIAATEWLQNKNMQ